MQYTFERYEKKFLLCEEQYERFMACLLYTSVSGRKPAVQKAIEFQLARMQFAKAAGRGIGAEIHGECADTFLQIRKYSFCIGDGFIAFKNNQALGIGICAAEPNFVFIQPAASGNLRSA